MTTLHQSPNLLIKVSIHPRYLKPSCLNKEDAVGLPLEDEETVLRKASHVNQNRNLLLQVQRLRPRPDQTYQKRKSQLLQSRQIPALSHYKNLHLRKSNNPLLYAVTGLPLAVLRNPSSPKKSSRPALQPLNSTMQNEQRRTGLLKPMKQVSNNEKRMLVRSERRKVRRRGS